jgi:hypothetical protein
MSFEAINYAHKRVRQQGSQEWKLWFTVVDNGLLFRMLTKNADGSCYETLTGEAHAIPEDDLHVWEDDNDDAYFTERYTYRSTEGTLDIYLEAENQELVWVRASGAYAADKCSLGLAVPLMPEVAG